MAGLIKTW